MGACEPAILLRPAPSATLPSMRVRFALIVVVAAAAVAAGLFAVRHRAALASWWRGETDLDGNRRYRPPHRADRAALDAIDFARVHGELLPDWVFKTANADSD